MFASISPQKVKHSSGFIVQVADRCTVEYIDGKRKACITVDFAPLGSSIYKDTLTDWQLSDGEIEKMTSDERTHVLRNIGEGMTFMGVTLIWLEE